MIESGTRAPDLSLPTMDGASVRLSEQFRKGPTLLVFFKEECGACRVALPRLPRIVEAYANVTVWAVSQEGRDATARVLDELAPGLPTLVDGPELAASEAYGLESVPSFFLVDNSGAIVDTHVGWDRTRFNELAGRAAELSGAAAREVVGDGDGPAFRPG